MDNLDKLDAAVCLVLDHLTNANAHTIAALLEWHYNGTGNDDTMLKAYKAAQYVITPPCDCGDCSDTPLDQRPPKND